jgi:hypothetical protein
MEDLLVDKEQWIIVDPGTQPTSTQYTIYCTQILVHKLLVLNLLVCQKKIGRRWIEEKGV